MIRFAKKAEGMHTQAAAPVQVWHKLVAWLREQVAWLRELVAWLREQVAWLRELVAWLREYILDDPFVRLLLMYYSAVIPPMFVMFALTQVICFSNIS